MWLLGVGYHRTGDRDDAYAYLKDLDDADRLFPDEEDYRLLHRWREMQGTSNIREIVQAARQQGPSLLQKAESGVECTTTLCDALVIDVKVERREDDARQVFVRFRMPPLQAGVLPTSGEWQLLLIPAFLPESVSISDLEWDFDGGIVAKAWY